MDCVTFGFFFVTFGVRHNREKTRIFYIGNDVLAELALETERQRDRETERPKCAGPERVILSQQEFFFNRDENDHCFVAGRRRVAPLLFNRDENDHCFYRRDTTNVSVPGGSAHFLPPLLSSCNKNTLSHPVPPKKELSFSRRDLPNPAKHPNK